MDVAISRTQCLMTGVQERCLLETWKMSTDRVETKSINGIVQFYCDCRRYMAKARAYSCQSCPRDMLASVNLVN